ncbi:hypothetical protein QBC38DRAFT_218791 [Podospora fimiseda]|uniref:RNA polymerase II degradation factor 1 n=1 Tax=Podospora fimiseda TaxID=252190 RepID=A0AAN7BNA8_9PEZI|nr:hypothetical protein QBC38DRAFT_218791 [Podospora fimiseda]
MSEVQRPAASRSSRGSGRGGRAGYPGRGGRTTTRTNGDSKHDTTDSALPTLEDEGEVAQLKALYGSKIAIVKELFADWTDIDILYALKETSGDADETVSRIMDGTISRWEEAKDRNRPKPKNDTFTTTTAEPISTSGQRNIRGGRGFEGGRGGRGRATERGGRGGSRGKPQAATNGTRTHQETQPLSVPTEEAWGTTPPAEETSGNWESIETTPATTAPAPTPAAAASKPSTIIESSQKTTWASMLRQSTTPKPAPKPKEAPAPAPVPETAEPAIEPLPPAPVEPEVVVAEVSVEVEAEVELTPEPLQEQPVVPVPVEAPAPVVPVIPAVVVPEVALLPGRDQLTDKNLEKLPDTSTAPETETARSEAADSWDPRGAQPSATATPISASQQQHLADRVPASGFAVTANKAAARPPTFPRRVLDQQEAVRMPGNRDAVDRAAVQFGAFSLNGSIDDDIDGDREEPETRPQPPQDSPVTHPRTSLPPAQPAAVPEAFSAAAQKPAPTQIPTGPAGMDHSSTSVSAWLSDANLTPAAAAPAAPTNPSVPTPAVAPAPGLQNNQQFGRFGQSAPEPSSFPTSKPFDPYGQSQQPTAAAAQNQFDGSFQGQLAQAQNQQHSGAAFSSAPSDFSSYYASSDPSRYGHYYQNYGQQQGAQGQQDGLSSQPQRSFAGYNNAPQNDTLSQYPQSGAQHTQSRYGSGPSPADAQIGAAAPAPTQPATQAQTPQTTQAQSHGQQQPQADFPYGSHPYFNSPYYSAYMGQYGGYNQGGYGAPYGKGGVYNPSGYGMTPQGPHAYGNAAGGFGQSSLHRDTAAGGLGDYGRAGNQGAQQQSGFGMHDAFARGGSGYQSQAGQSFNAPGSQPGSGPSAVDDLKSFSDAKGGAGPSPSLGVAARPGSAANNGSSQGGLPPPQSTQQSALGGMGYGGYPGNMQQGQGHSLHNTQSGAAGYGMGASSGQSHQNSYGNYGQSFGGNYQNYPRGSGWSSNYH